MRSELDWSVKCLSHSCSNHVAAHGATVVLLPSNVAASPRAILLEVFLVVDRVLKQASVPFLLFSFVLSCFLFGCEIVHHQLGILSCGDSARVASCCRRALSIQVLLYGCPGPPFESLRVLFPSCGLYCLFSVKIALLQGLCVYHCVKSLWGALVRRFEVCRMRITITSTQESRDSCSFLQVLLQLVGKGERRPD